MHLSSPPPIGIWERLERDSTSILGDIELIRRDVWFPVDWRHSVIDQALYICRAGGLVEQDNGGYDLCTLEMVIGGFSGRDPASLLPKPYLSHIHGGCLKIGKRPQAQVDLYDRLHVLSGCGLNSKP